MENMHELPLKVLWIFNTNESDIAIDFYLSKDGKSYQVKGSGANAFGDNGKLKTCLTDNLDNISYQYPNKSVYIKSSEATLKKIWNYWKKESGELRFNSFLKSWEDYNNKQQKTFFEQEGPQNKESGTEPSSSPINLKRKQVMDLVFEIGALVDMLKASIGEVPAKQIEDLIEASTKGFSEESKELFYKEARRKNLI